MEENFNEFAQVANELDELSLEGYFGKEANGLVERRDTLDTVDFLVECLDVWIQDKEQYGKEKVKELILIFFELYASALQIHGQEAIDVLTCFWKGTPDNSGTESLSSYMEFAHINTEFKIILSDIRKKPKATFSDKKRLATSVITAYSKGVELIGKILTPCILLEEIEQGQEFNIMKIYNLTLHNKILLFQRLSKGRYDKLINSINRSIRNGDAHLNIHFVPSEDGYLFKMKRGNKIITEKISTITMLTEVYPQPGWVVQAFIYSSVLLILSQSLKEMYKEKISQIFGS